MPFDGTTYEQRSEDDIREALEAELEDEFGSDIDLTESSVFATLADVLGAVLAANQEQSIKEVYESAFLETATSGDLDRVVSLLGLTRRPATHATGVQRFNASGKVTQDHTIQRGTVVQTSGENPIQFETSEPVILELFDDFEDGDLSEYSGDLTDASVVTSDAYRGSNALELAATAGAHIYNTSADLDQGSEFHAHAKPQAGTVPIFTFGVQPASPGDYYQVAFDEAANEVRLETVVGGTVNGEVDSVSVTLNADSYYEADISWTITDNIGISVKNTDGDELATLGGESSTYQRGYVGFKSGGANGVKHLDYATSSARSADIRSVEPGAMTNVGANSISVIPSPPAGVNTTTNLYPTGDTDYFDTSDLQFNVGSDEESDTELRERAQEATSGGGSATHDAIVNNIINTVDSVSSVTLYENKTDTQTDGMPPYSFEVVVFGGSDQEVANAIFDKKAVTAWDYSGVNGQSVTETVVADSNGQQRDISFSRPNEVTVDMTLDIIVDDTYIGDDALRDRIVEYVGGTMSDGVETSVGLGVGENVRVDVLRDIIIGDDTGVVAFDQNVDSDPITTTPSTTVENGIQAVSVGDASVATTDATDNSIVINSREQ